jgi:hypothetical protein
MPLACALKGIIVKAVNAVEDEDYCCGPQT